MRNFEIKLRFHTKWMADKIEYRIQARLLKSNMKYEWMNLVTLASMDHGWSGNRFLFYNLWRIRLFRSNHFAFYVFFNVLFLTYLHTTCPVLSDSLDNCLCKGKFYMSQSQTMYWVIHLKKSLEVIEFLTLARIDSKKGKKKHLLIWVNWSLSSVRSNEYWLTLHS